MEIPSTSDDTWNQPPSRPKLSQGLYFVPCGLGTDAQESDECNVAVFKGLSKFRSISNPRFP
jgi:hypothetical protein